MDDGTVVTSGYNPNTTSWTFTTLYTPEDDWHPVSGNRKFGFTQNSDGSYIFYTKGVDRFTQDITGELVAQVITLGDPFSGADKLWSSFQKGIKTYVNTHGGNASINEPEYIRPDWGKLQDYFDGNATLNSLGCN